MKDLLPGLPVAVANHYLAAFDVAAIYVAAASETAPARFGTIADAALRRLAGETNVTALWGRASDIRVLAALLRAATRPASESMTFVTMVETIEAAAAARQIKLTPHPEVLRRAQRTVQKIDEEHAAMQAAGKFKAMNRAYRAARERGDDVPKTYSAFMTAMKLRAIDALSERVTSQRRARLKPKIAPAALSA